MRTSINSYILISIIGFSSVAFAEQSAPEKYIGKWKSTAIEQMLNHNIPASITLAQGVLESGSGTSMLAVKANNHFGIKCHNWQGEKVYKDDDKKNECFRSYRNAEESFDDHSKFLTGRGRYASLFTLKPTDYKGWAKGLKKAGYATSRTYATRLIELIERYDLNQYDAFTGFENNPAPLAVKDKKVETKKVKDLVDNTINIQKGHDVFKMNSKTKYIVAKEGDTYYRISREFGLGLWQLYQYNDGYSRKDLLNVGDIIYLQPKKHRVKGLESYTVKSNGETLGQISQKLGIKLKSLIKKNPSIPVDAKLSKGTRIHLKR